MLASRGASIREDRVGAGLEIEPRARDRAVHPFAGRGVGARDDVEMPARASRRRDLGRHVARAGQLLVVEMPAFLGQQLIFQMDRPGAGLLEGAYHVHRVERLAIAGVAIDEHGQRAGACDLTDEEADLVDGDDAEIGDPHRRRHRRAGEVERLEPGRPRLQRGEAVMRPRDPDDAGARKQFAETHARGTGVAVFSDEIGHQDLPVAERITSRRGAAAAPAGTGWRARAA
jgi:hypothetical protein